MNMQDTSDMRAFVRVVERNSFSAAAEDLGISASAVSKLVARLEDRLGARLIRRTTRRLSLTPEGELYFARTRKILADIEDAEAEIARAGVAPRGLLRINTGSAFATHQLAHALPQFVASYPDLAVELSVTDHMVDLVEDYSDVAIRAGPVPDTNLSARKIADFERMICAAPSYLARYGVPQGAADLAKHVCISLTLAEATRWPFRTSRGIEQIEIAPRLTCDNAEVALRLALAGAGIVRLGDVLVSEPIRRGLLVPLLTDVHFAEPIALSAI